MLVSIASAVFQHHTNIIKHTTFIHVIIIMMEVGEGWIVLGDGEWGGG